MTKAQKWTLMLVAFIAAIFAIGYLASEKGQPYTLEDCVKSCKPRAGVMVQSGPTVGPDWRPSRRGVNCVCQ
jgi:hypothetical protein